jgi:hypothetical protein
VSNNKPSVNGYKLNHYRQLYAGGSNLSNGGNQNKYGYGNDLPGHNVVNKSVNYSLD